MVNLKYFRPNCIKKTTKNKNKKTTKKSGGENQLKQQKL